MKKLVGLVLLWVAVSAHAQVDTSYVYNTTMPYGTLDIRIAKSPTRYYYLQENVTFSFRESAPGVKTNSFYDMTSWDSSPYTQGNLREKNGSADAFVMNYRLLFPLNYNPSYADGYPLIVMMHGAGERGNCWDATCHWATRTYRPQTNNPVAPTSGTHPLLNNDHNLTHGGAPHLDARNLAAGKLPNDPTLKTRAFPGFVLFAQNLNGWDIAATQDALRLIRLVAKKYKIDPDRIYIHGLSNGGAATYEAIKRAPWMFAAALPMSAISDGSIITKGLAPAVAHIPLWTFQGGKDTSPTPFKTETYVKRFREAGANVRYSLYSNLGHGTWNTAYAEPDFFSWILAQNKSKLHVFYNNAAICGTTNQGVKLGLAAGFRAYQWEKDGQVIADATGPEYIANEPGNYRARFARVANPSEGDWNQWSQVVTVTLSNPATPNIEITGTTYMRGPDNNSAYNKIVLKSSTTNDKYFWYKNGTLVNIPLTTVDDTTRYYTINSSSSSANGSFTVVTKGFDNCPSPTSAPVNLYFGNSGPLMADSNIPTNFSGAVASASEVDVTWTDNAQQETGYEIWARKAGGIFKLVGKAAANATSYHVSGLEPSSEYHFKIRAVDGQSRSKYAPADALTTNLVLTTLGDYVNPTAPTGLQVVSNTASTITLKWTASTDNTAIRQYHIYYGPNEAVTQTNVTQFTLTGLPINTAWNITVVAEDLAGNLSTASDSVVGRTYVSGLIYGHSTGAWTTLTAITTWATPEFTGTVPNFTLAPRTQEDFFFFEFKGYLFITTGGAYQFRTTSDDGSRLTLNNVLIVDNDGLHGNVTVTSAALNLVAGPQDINVRFFEYTGGQSLTVEYKGPDTGGAWKVIPDAALRSGATEPLPSSVVVESKPEELSARIVAEEAGSKTNAYFTLSVYPNPATSDQLNIRVQSEDDAPVHVTLVDMMGKVHHEQVYEKAALDNGTPVTPTASLLNGIYVLTVNQGNRVIKEKVIIKN